MDKPKHVSETTLLNVAVMLKKHLRNAMEPLIFYGCYYKKAKEKNCNLKKLIRPEIFQVVSLCLR